MGAPNHYGERRKVPTMSQVLSSIQYMCFLKDLKFEYGGAKLASCPGPGAIELRYTPGFMLMKDTTGRNNVQCPFLHQSCET